MLDELKNNISEEELEQVSGGIATKNCLRCSICGCKFMSGELAANSELNEEGIRVHKGCGGILVTLLQR